MLAESIQYLFPGIDMRGECILQDDGKGPYIKQWLRTEPNPTTAELEAAYPLALVSNRRASTPSVSRRQMFTALHRAGLLDMIKTTIAASGDIELQIAFDESQEFQRNNPFLATMAQALGKSDEEVDAIFALAASI